MNPPPNPPSGHQGDPTWVTHDSSWDQHAANASQYQHQQQQPVAGGTSSSRPDWEWENQMLLSSAAEVEGERKPVMLPLPTATICHRPYASNYTSTAIPHSFSHQHNALANYNGPASAMRSTYAGLEGGGYHSHPVAAAALLGQGGTASDLNAELRSYEQRRRFLGMHLFDPEQGRNVLDFVKREDMYSLGEHARIGLNLGGRTYFSAEDSRLGKRSRLNSLAHVPMCQVQGCTADLGKAKHYHRRHKVCEIHSKAPNVIANGQTQRFCQQCSRFHQLSEFDDTKRSCRKRLADHNRRRRKPQPSAVVTISDSYKTEEQSTNIRPAADGDHKPMLMHHMQKSGSPTASITDRDSISSGGNNRLQNQSPTYGTASDEKLANRESLLRSQNIPSSHVQALVLSVVSRTGSSTQSTRQSAGTQESGYQYLQGPSLSLSSAGLSGQTHHHSPSSQNYSSMEQQPQQQQQPQSVPWLASCSGSRSTLVQARPLQTFPPTRDLQSGSSPQFMLQPASKATEWTMGSSMPREQLGRLGFQNVHSSIDGRQMLALIENPNAQQQQQQTHQLQPASDVKPLLQHTELQNSGVRSSFGSSFYDSSSSIG